MSDISEVEVRFPWLLVAPRDERTISVFSSLKPVDSLTRPMECVLRAILGSSSLTKGLEVFFLQETEDEKRQAPFYLLSTYDKIITIDVKQTKEILYELGELQAAERVESIPFVYLAEGISTERDGLVSPSAIWKVIFDKLSRFRKSSIYWIEDDINVLIKAGISPPSRMESDQVNLLDKSRGEAIFISRLDWEEDNAKVVWNCDKSAFWSIDESRSWQSQIVTKLDEILGKKRTRDGFNIFIIDVYLGKGKNISIFGDKPIDIIRNAEYNKREVRPLIISWTAGISPYLISMIKSIGADFVIFKGAYGTGHGGVMRGGEETGLFYLLGAIYWPLSIVAYTCKKLKKILGKAKKKGGIDTEDLTVSIRELKAEVDRLYPRHYVVFWEGWIENLFAVLTKWEFALNRGSMGSVSSLREDFINDLNDCLEQAHYSG